MRKIKYLCKVAILCMGIILAGINPTIISYAQETELYVQPRMLYIAGYDTDLNISNSGMATVSGSVQGMTGDSVHQ